MDISNTSLIQNIEVFGVATLLTLLIAFILGRQARRLTRFIFGVFRAADNPKFSEARDHVEKSLRRVITLATAVFIILLLAGAFAATWWSVDLLALCLAWFEEVFMEDISATIYAGLKLLGVAGALLLAYALARALIGSLLRTIGQIGALSPHKSALEKLRVRLFSLVRAASILTLLLTYSAFAGAPPLLHRPLLTLTYVVLGVTGARAFATLCTVGVDIGGQLVKALGDLNSPLGYVGRFERLDQVVILTKRSLEYLVFLVATTWIASKLQPGTVLEDLGLRLIRVLALVYVGRVLVEVVNLFVRELLTGSDSQSTREHQQRHTLLPIVQSALRYGIYFLLIVMGLSELGVETGPLIAGAGLGGVALGLGAQAFVGDIVSGFFIFLEGLILVGDRVQVGEVIGIVEAIGIRAIKIRHENGVLHTVPNGEVRSIANHTATYVNAVVDFTIAYEEDVPRIMAAVKEHIEEFRLRYPDIIGETEVVVEDLGRDGALIETLTRVKPGRDEDASEAIRAEILAVLTQLGVAPQGSRSVRISPRIAGLAG